MTVRMNHEDDGLHTLVLYNRGWKIYENMGLGMMYISSFKRMSFLFALIETTTRKNDRD
jgi:hypothetical protein